jgi:hypothetical protein
MAYKMTAARRKALRKAQIASARKRRGRRRRSTNRRIATVLAVGTVATLAGRRTSSHVKLFKEAREFQSSGFDPESGYGPGRAKYTYFEHLGYRRMHYKSHRKSYRNKMTRIITGKQSKHPLANGILAMQVQSGQYKYQTRPQKLIKTTIRYRQSMQRYKSDPTL